MPIDPQHIRNISNTFMTAYGRCMEQRSLPTGEFQMPLVPAVVCLAFSIETGFKAILTKTGKNIRGHDLSKLFEELPSNDQDFIIKNIGGMNAARFRSELGKIANAFVEWRYIYEKENAHININFLKELALATQILNLLG